MEYSIELKVKWVEDYIYNNYTIKLLKIENPKTLLFRQLSDEKFTLHNILNKGIRMIENNEYSKWSYYEVMDDYLNQLNETMSHTTNEDFKSRLDCGINALIKLIHEYCAAFM